MEDQDINQNKNFIYAEVFSLIMYFIASLLCIYGVYRSAILDDELGFYALLFCAIILFLSGFFISKRGKRKAIIELNTAYKNRRSMADVSYNILIDVWSSCDFKQCSRCKDNYLFPIKSNSSGTSMEYKCQSCGKKSWSDTVPNNKDWNGDEILLAWETVVSWNQDNPHDEISLGFKFTPKEKGNTVELKEEKRSREISQDVKDKVWNRDGGKCVQCGSNEDLEFDHIIPHSKGGANTYRNIQLLCEPCNRKKSANIG